MPEDRLAFHVAGPGAEGLAAELSAKLEEILGEKPARPGKPAKPPGTRGVDPISLTALILSIPGFVLATADLVERLELAEKLGELLAWLKEKKEEEPDREVSLTLPSGKVLPFEKATPAEILEGRRPEPKG